MRGEFRGRPAASAWRYNDDGDGPDAGPRAPAAGGPPADAGRADLDLFVVHHSVITAEVIAVEAAEGAEDAADGGAAVGGGNPGLFGIVHELGQNATVFPDHVGVKLPANSVLTYRNTHLHSIGRRVRARLDTAFTFHPPGHEPKYRQTTGAQAGGFELEPDIPAGESNVLRDGFFRVQRPTMLMTFCRA